MSTQARIGHGVLFQRQNDDSPPTYDSIAEVTNVSGPSLSRETQDASHSDSTERWRDFIAGMKDGGEVTVTMNFLPDHDTQKYATDGLLKDFDSNSLRNYRITFPGDSPQVSWTFAGLLTGWNPEVPVGETMTVTASFKVSGKPTLA